MADRTVIAWTDKTFNPWMGCQKVSDGCLNCYAERLTRSRMGLHLWGGAPRRITSDANWRKPLAWNRKAESSGVRLLVFCGSLMDFAEDRRELESPRWKLWQLIKATPSLTWQLLTKRPENLPNVLPRNWGNGYPNVWLGTTIEDMRVAERADHLRAVPALVRFISYEPALGPLDDLDLTGIRWVVYGGESGTGFRDHDLAWPREMRDRCASLGISYFYKQSPAYRTDLGTTLDGQTIRQFPIPASQRYMYSILGSQQAATL